MDQDNSDNSQDSYQRTVSFDPQPPPAVPQKPRGPLTYVEQSGLNCSVSTTGYQPVNRAGVSTVLNPPTGGSSAAKCKGSNSDSAEFRRGYIAGQLDMKSRAIHAVDVKCDHCDCCKNSQHCIQSLSVDSQ